MPVYEYRCDDCGEVFDLFVRSVQHQKTPTCPKCQSTKVSRNISLFGVGGSRSSRTVSTGGASCSTGSL